jgi:prepilin-type N-terminal cleavage/methylation domain-containing protein
MKQKQAGYTLVELLIVIVLLGILIGFAFVGLPNSQRDGRDTERVTDIDTLQSRLEDYYSDHAGYPASLSTAALPRLDPAALKDPAGQNLKNNTPVSDQSAAKLTANPTTSPNQYIYTAYPINCDSLPPCTGYVLKSFIESPTAKRSNPYVKRGINNN